MTQFTDLGLAKPLLKALEAEGYTTPTPIQAQAIPSVMLGRDLLGIAQTGTGKTAAFALPILHRLAEDRKPAPRRGARCVVLSPTRELASQIAESFRTYGAHMGMTVTVVFGGAKYGPQIKALATGVDILVATPGRLIDHLGEKTADLSSTEILVLDEADQMLDLGFLQPIRRIVSGMSRKRQNLFFSATMDKTVEKLINKFSKDAVRVTVQKSINKTPDQVDLGVYEVESDRKVELLRHMLTLEDGSFLVFTRTKHGADRLTKRLSASGIRAVAMHGDRTQNQRNQALAGFRENRYRVLVATDVAARGIHVDSVAHVVNFDLPQAPDDFVHRVGRTGRAGQKGSASTFSTRSERGEVKRIERECRVVLQRREVSPAILTQIAESTPKPVAVMAEARPPQQHHQRKQGKKSFGSHEPKSAYQSNFRRSRSVA